MTWGTTVDSWRLADAAHERLRLLRGIPGVTRGPSRYVQVVLWRLEHHLNRWCHSSRGPPRLATCTFFGTLG